jgi:hypothetical protein
MSAPRHVDPLQWQQAVGFSRQACARVFRDGGSARDAVRAFAVDAPGLGTADWARAVDLVAAALCRRPLVRAA